MLFLLLLLPLKHVAPTELDIRVAGGVYKYSAPTELARLHTAWPRCVLCGSVSALKREPGRGDTINVLPLLRAETRAEGLTSGLFRPLLTILRRSLLSRAFAN